MGFQGIAGFVAAARAQTKRTTINDKNSFFISPSSLINPTSNARYAPIIPEISARIAIPLPEGAAQAATTTTFLPHPAYYRLGNRRRRLGDDS